MGDTLPERNSDGTSANAYCSSERHIGGAHNSSTSAAGSGCNLRNACRIVCSPPCASNDVSSSITRSSDPKASHGSSSDAVWNSTYSRHNTRICNYNDSAGLRTRNYADSGRTNSDRLNKTDVCRPRKAGTAAAGLKPPCAVVKLEDPMKTPPTADIATVEGHSCSCCDHASDEATALWAAFFADGATDLGLLLLAELHRQMRAQHLQEAHLLSCSRVTASSLPSCLDLRRLLHIASAGAAAAAAAAAIQSQPTVSRQPAGDSSVLRMSLLKAPVAAVCPVISLAPPNVDVLIADDKSAQSGTRFRASDTAAAPAAADVLLSVDQKTLQGVLQLLPILAFKESEELLRGGDSVIETGLTNCVERRCYLQPRQSLGAGTCDAMIHRLKRMLFHWDSLVKFWINIHCRNKGNVCSRKIGGSFQRGNTSCIGASLAERFRNESMIDGTSNAASCCSASGGSVYKSSDRSACTSTSQGSRAFVTRGESSCPCWSRAECRHRQSAETLFASPHKSLQQLLAQILYPHALITAVMWGRQAHLYEERRLRRGRGHIHTGLACAHKPRQPQQPQMQEQDGEETSQRLHEYICPQQDMSPVSRPEELTGEGDVTEQRESMPWRKYERQQHQEVQMQQEPQRNFEESSLQECLQRLLLLMQRARIAADGHSGNSSSMRFSPKEAQRQRELIILYMLQLLSFCRVGGEMKPDTHETMPAADYSVGNGVNLEEPQEAEKQQQQPQSPPYLQQDVERHAPVRPYHPPATTATAELHCSVGELGRRQVKSVSAARGERGTNNTGGTSMKLAVELLLCDSQLYIHPAGPISCSVSGSVQAHRCGKCSSISFQRVAARQVPIHTEWNQGPARGFSRQVDCMIGDECSVVQETPSRDPTQPGDVAAASFKELTASILAVQGAKHAWPAGEVRMREGIIAIEPSTGEVSSDVVTRGAAQEAEPMAGTPEHLILDAYDFRSTATTAAAPLHRAAGAQGSDIASIRGDPLVSRSHHSSPLSSLAADTASKPCTTSCVLWHPSCDSEAPAAHWYRASAEENCTWRALASEVPPDAAKPCYGHAVRRPGIAEKLSECEATTVSLQSAAASPSFSSCHLSVFPCEVRRSCWACPSTTITLSTQRSTICCANWDGHCGLEGFEGANRIAARRDNQWSRRAAADLSGSPFRAPHGVVPGAALSGHRWQNKCSSCSFGYRRLVGHPQDLELFFRPAVVRISLLHTRGSFRSLFKTRAPTTVAPIATAVEPQQQVELQRQLVQRQHVEEHDARHALGVDSPILLPELLQEESHHSQIVCTSAEPASTTRNSVPAPVVPDAMKTVQKAQAEEAKELTTTRTTTSVLSDSTRESWRDLPPLRGTCEVGVAIEPDPLNSCASCRRCNCCSSVRERGSYIGEDRYRSCSRQRATTLEAAEPEDVLVCCFFETGAVTLNGRIVQFFDYGENRGCLPCIVDVLLLSWYGADPLPSESSSPALRPAPRPCTAVEERGRDFLGQYTPSTVSTCSSNSANCDGALSTPQASTSSEASGRRRNSGTSSRTSDGHFTTSRKSGSNRLTSSCSFSPLLLCSSSEPRTEAAMPSITGDTGALAQLGYSPGTCTSLPLQSHVCLLFLAANGTLFCSGDVPSVYLPPCITCGASSLGRGRSPSGCPVFHNCSGVTPTNVPGSVPCGKGLPEQSENQRESPPPLTAARYGTLYDAVCLPAVCAATRRPLLFGSLLASNTAAIALTSNLLLPRYKRRVPLHQRQLSFKVLTCNRSKPGGAIPLQPGHGDENCFAVDSLRGAPIETATMALPCGTPSGCGCAGHTGAADEAEETSVQWKLAATAAGSGAAVAVLQAHTGEPVLLQPHRQEVVKAATRAIWRGNAATVSDFPRSSDNYLTCTESSHFRQCSSSEGTPPMGPSGFAGFSLRFVTLPDLRSLSQLQPKRDSSLTGGLCRDPTEAHVEKRKSVHGREGTPEMVTEEHGGCMLAGAGSAQLASEVLHKAVKQQVHGAGRETDPLFVKTCKMGSNRQDETLSSDAQLQHVPLPSRSNPEGLQSMPPALSFLLRERWVACCLYKDLILLKTVSHAGEDGCFPAVGVLLTNLEEELHEWVANFFETHPHVLRSARYMRLGCEKLSKRSRKLHFRQPLMLQASGHQGFSYRKPQNEQKDYSKHYSEDHENGQQRGHPQEPGLTPQRKGLRRPHDQQTGTVLSQHYQQAQQLKAQVLTGYIGSVDCISAAGVHQSVQSATASNERYCHEFEPASCKETSLTSSARVVALQSSSHHRFYNRTAHGNCGSLDLRVGWPSDASASTAERVIESMEPGQKLQRLVTRTAAASSNCHAENEVFELDNGDGELRLFVNTEGDGFYCLNLQRRCLEAAWPEASLP